MSLITIDTLAHHPHLVGEVVDIAWTDWGTGLPEEEYRRWLSLAKEDARVNDIFHACFVAIDGGRAVGTVQLHRHDIPEMNDRSPWVCGMIVRPDYRGQHIGRRLLDALATFATERGVRRLWVWTDSAAGFYEACGWTPIGEVQTGGETGVVLYRDVLETQ